MANYWFLSECGRGRGKTTAICKAAQEIGATVVVHNQQEAKRVAKEHGVRTVVMDTDGGNRFRGTQGPYLIDSHAAAVELTRLDFALTQLREENTKLRAVADAARLVNIAGGVHWCGEAPTCGNITLAGLELEKSLAALDTKG